MKREYLDVLLALLLVLGLGAALGALLGWLDGAALQRVSDALDGLFGQVTP